MLCNHDEDNEVPANSTTLNEAINAVCRRVRYTTQGDWFVHRQGDEKWKPLSDDADSLAAVKLALLKDYCVPCAASVADVVRVSLMIYPVKRAVLTGNRYGYGANPLWDYSV